MRETVRVNVLIGLLATLLLVACNVQTGEELSISSTQRALTSDAGVTDLEINDEDTQVAASTTPANSCVTKGTGDQIGDQIADFSLQNCNGDIVSLHSRCGKTKAIWIAAVTGWCQYCGDAVDAMAQAYTQYASQGLDVMVVLGQNASQGAPTLTYCKRYAKSHNIDPSLVYIDNTNGKSWYTLFNNINDYNMTGIPWQAVLDGADMSYDYCDTCGSGDLETTLSDLLSK